MLLPTHLRLLTPRGFQALALLLHSLLLISILVFNLALWRALPFRAACVLRLLPSCGGHIAQGL